MKSFILLSGCIVWFAADLVAQSQKTSLDTLSTITLVHTISLIQLIANPEKYHQKTVEVEGYLTTGFENNALYLHKEDYDNNLLINAVYVAFSERSIDKKILIDANKKYTILVGIFDMNGGSFYSGAIKNITRVGKWFSNK